MCKPLNYKYGNNRAKEKNSRREQKLQSSEALFPNKAGQSRADDSTCHRKHLLSVSHPWRSFEQKNGLNETTTF